MLRDRGGEGEIPETVQGLIAADSICSSPTRRRCSRTRR